MQVTVDQWTPLFKDLQSRINGQSRRKLLFQIIGEIQDITVNIFGDEGIARPFTWRELTPKYAHRWKYGDTTPTLKMSDEMHNKRHPEGLPHLIDGFVHTFDENKATLTNVSPYADIHQFGGGRMFRPYYPVSQTGETLSPYAMEKVREILDLHFQ